jgi:hypothetical protein
VRADPSIIIVTPSHSKWLVTIMLDRPSLNSQTDDPESVKSSSLNAIDVGLEKVPFGPARELVMHGGGVLQCDCSAVDA